MLPHYTKKRHEHSVISRRAESYYRGRGAGPTAAGLARREEILRRMEEEREKTHMDSGMC